MHRHLWLGRDYSRYGMLHCQLVVPGAGVALSVGSDQRSPSLASKGRREVPNEDGLVVLAQGDWLLLAVADGHLGAEGSHTLLERLWESAGVPHSAGHLGLQLLDLAYPPWPGSAGTTLLLAGLNQATGQGFGLSWGDSAALVLGPGAAARQLTQPTDNYLRAGQPLEAERAQPFEFTLEPDQVLLLCTDGVTECHYGSPLSSLTPERIGAVFARTDPAGPEDVAWALGQQALQGVNGHPGGQDNLALIVARRNV